MEKLIAFTFLFLGVSSIFGVQVESTQEENACYFDVGFVLDVSGSMKYFDKRQRTFLKLMTKELNISANGNRAALVHFSTHAEHDIKLKDHQSSDSFNRALDNIPLLEKYTRIDIALKLAHNEIFLEENGGRANLPKLLILMTDGNQTNYPDAIDPARVAQNIRRTGIRVIVIGTGVVKASQLAKIASGDEWHNITALREKKGELFASKVKELMCPVCADNFDIGFILDSSGSLRYHYHYEKDFIAKIAEAFHISQNGTKAGVITFSTDCEVSINLNDHDDVKSFIRALKEIPLMNGLTRIDRALQLADSSFFRTENGARKEMPKVLILLTDGSQTQAPGMLDPALIAKDIRDKNVKMVVIGVGRGINKTELIEISGDEDNTYDVRSFEELTGKLFVDQMKKATCRFGKYGFNLNKEGKRAKSKVKIIPTKPLPTTKTIQQPVCDGLFDIGILLDVSGTNISSKQYREVQTFIKQLSSAFEINRRGSHMGLISTYDIATIEIRLNQHYNAKSFSQAIAAMKHYQGESRVDDMLVIAEESFFVKKYGERNYAKDVLILVTDGIQNFGDMYNSIRLADKFRRRGGHVIVVRVGQNINEKVLLMIAGKRENIIRVENYGDLRNVVSEVHKKTCSIKSVCIDYYSSKCDMLARYCQATSKTMKRFMKAACCKTCSQPVLR